MTKTKKMEVSVENYGGMMFSNAFTPEGYYLPDHWASIMDEARPHINALIALNDKMINGGYEIVGIPDKKGKPKLSNSQRISLAKQKFWRISASDLVENDLVWLTRFEPEMYIGEHDPCQIEFLKNGVGVITDVWGEEVIIRLEKNEEVLRAPKDFSEKQDYYTSDEYWLEKADELGI
jgi:hypothetical protein